jgi:prephenate dehydrogenase
MKIAIIGGAGKMGKWLARNLTADGFEVIVSGRDQAKLISLQKEINVKVMTKAEAVENSDAVVISVPIDKFEDVVNEIAPSIKPEQIVMDITSIKEYPIDLMHRDFKTKNILGTHPVFGPGAKDFNSQNVVLTPTNDTEVELSNKVKIYLESKGARVSVMSPREHDEMMSVVLGLAHFISLVSADTLVGFNHMPQLKAIGGSTYRLLSTLVESVISEDPELYATLQMYLPGLAEIEDKFQSNAAKWAGYVKNRDKQAFKEDMTGLKKKFGQQNADFGKAYENMYKIMEWL